MNTKPSKITLKKQDLLLRNFSTQSYTLAFHRNYLLADYFTLISLRILGKFLWNFSEMLKSIFSLCTNPLPSIKIGGEGSRYTGYQSSASKEYCVTLPVNNNLHTCNLHFLLYSRLYSIIIRSLQATPERLIIG